MAKITMREVKSLKDMSTEPANIPTGVWNLRAIALKSRSVDKKDKDGNEYETTEHQIVLEPFKPTASVDPDALAEKDEATGKPVYEGKRIFARFTESFPNEMKQLQQALVAFGFGDEEPHEGETTVGHIAKRIGAANAVRGRNAMGEVFNRTYPKNDGTQGTEQKVRNWAPVGSSPSGLSI